jgi:hypothetical protein
MLEAYEHATGVEGRGAVMFGDEMIDEASRKMASRLAARGRAAGLEPSGMGAGRQADRTGRMQPAERAEGGTAS